MRDTMLKKSLFILGTISMVGCSTLTSLEQPKKKTDTPSQSVEPATKTIETPSGVKITPYEQEQIKRQQMRVVVPQQKVTQQKFNDGKQLPAFKSLMQKTQQAYSQMQWDDAERYALQAQRLAPQAPETFLFLAMVANQKGQYASGESLARRGLSFAQSNPMKKQLWLNILNAAQKQNNAKSIQQAQQALKSL